MSDKNALIQPDRGQKAIAIHLVDKDGFDSFLKDCTAPRRSALEAQKFKGEGFDHAIVPDGDGWAVVAGVATFVFYGLAPVALVLYIMGTPARRRRKAQAERAAQAGANAPPVAETPPEGKD